MRHEREAHTLAGPYAMDAISAPDRVRFERHLTRCEDCAREIASLREATARLAAAAAVSPPPALKARVMAAAAATRQRPPGQEPEAARAPPWPWDLLRHHHPSPADRTDHVRLSYGLLSPLSWGILSRWLDRALMG
jgi:hypothetical protein